MNMTLEQGKLVDRLLDLALDEDVGPGDVTTAALLSGSQVGAKGRFVARQNGVMAGGEVVKRFYARLGARYCDAAGIVSVKTVLPDGSVFAPGTVLLEVEGNAAAILTGERVALNILQRMCAVAARTRIFVDKVKGTKAVILDTRKTMPGHRVLDKMAVLAGGGQNHRMGLYDMVLIKDNHLAAYGSPASAVNASRKACPEVPIMVEVDTLEQLRNALTAEPDYVLLDNMGPETLAEAVGIADACAAQGLARPLLEASGGVNLDSVRAIAEAGVDRISVGSITHGAGSVDIGLDFA